MPGTLPKSNVHGRQVALIQLADALLAAPSSVHGGLKPLTGARPRAAVRYMPVSNWPLRDLSRAPHIGGIMTTSTSAVSTQREPELLGQTVVIIGGSAGTGLETARRARTEGASVILTGRNPEGAAR